MDLSRTRVSHLAMILLVAAIAIGLPGAPRPTDVGTAPDGKSDPDGYYPSDWFYAQRAFPSGTIDHDVVIAAMDQARSARARLRTSVGSWEAAGPFNIGGRVAALAVLPGGNTIYLGAAGGGVFKSTDAGVNWTSVFDDASAFSIGALALDPSDPNTVYCGTGEANSAIDNYDGSGVYRTTNAGASWQYIGLAETRRIGRVAVDPSNPDRIFVAAMGSQFSTGPHRGLYRSEDGGANWSKVLFVNDSTGCADVVINPASPETVYCATWERVRRPTYRRAYGPGCGIWRSVDYGTTWTRLTNGLPAPGNNVGRIGLGMSPSKPWIVYAQIISGASGGYTGLGMYRTVDGGATWTRQDNSGFTGNFGGFGWYFGEVVVDPSNPETVFALGVGLMRSTNGGVNFSAMPGGNYHVDHHALWINPANSNHIYQGSDGGFYSTTNGGSSPWFQPSTLDITQFYAGTIDPSNPSRLLGGAQDNNTTMTNGSPAGWFPILGGDGFYCLVDHTNPQIVFAEWQNGSGGQGPQRSENGGVSFTAHTQFPSGRFNWMTPFVMNPKNNNVLLVGSQRVNRSTNNGRAYSAISPDLTHNQTSQLTYSTITTLDISAPDTSLYYAGTDDGRVWRSPDRGQTWIEITAGLPIRWVTRVTADPADPDVVYVTLSGFTQDEYAAHVYRSPNRGFTWFPISGNLPNIPVNDIVVDPGQPQWLYVATDLGVYGSFDQGATWAPLGTGLPFSAVYDLTIHHPSRTLVAATHGRSQWRLQLDTAPVAVGPLPKPVSAPALSAPSPNPSRGEARLTLVMDERGRADVGVYDAGGRRVRNLLAERIEAGSRVITWDGRDDRGGRAGAGVYFVRARTPNGEVSRRLVRVD